MTVHNASYLLTDNNFLSIKNNFMRKGFTLIELLVVIAIIGILSSVVLASLNSARSKGSDAAIKSNINNARAQAELYYDGHGQSYTGVCNATDGLAPMKEGVTGAGGTPTCIDNGTNGGTVTAGDAYVFYSPLKSKASEYYCVSSNGQATTTTDHPGADDTTCY